MTRSLPSEPVSSRAAWLPQDFKNDDSWIVNLSEELLEELNSAVRKCKRQGLSALQASVSDFSAPKLAMLARDLRRELDAGRGFVLIRGIPVDRYDRDSLRLLYWGIGIHLGTPISQNGLGDLISEVVDRGYDYDTANVRGYTTRGGQSPHTDHGDVVGLLCVHPAKSGGKSMIASGISIFNEVLRTKPDYLPLLAAGFHLDLRGEGPTRDLNEVTRSKIPVFSCYDGRLSVKFNVKTARSGMAKAGLPLDVRTLAAFEYVRELARSDTFRFDMEFRKGDVQLLCNHSILHARSGYEDLREEERKRRLYRMWVNLPDGRRLAPEFADRTNMGYMAGFYSTADAKYWAGAPGE